MEFNSGFKGLNNAFIQNTGLLFTTADKYSLFSLKRPSKNCIVELPTIHPKKI
jgi:hypothetical protein